MTNGSIQIKTTVTPVAQPQTQIIGGGARATVPLGPYSAPIQPQPRMPAVDEAAVDPPPCAAASSVGAMPLPRAAEVAPISPPPEWIHSEHFEQIADAFTLGFDRRTLWPRTLDELLESMNKGPKTALRTQDTPAEEMERALRLSRGEKE